MPHQSTPDRLCSVDDCGLKHFADGLCRKHHQRWKRHGDPLYAIGAHGPAEQRFWAKVDRSGDCWLWTAARDRDGYGIFGVDWRTRNSERAPRYSWELANGPIPDGMMVCHRCDNPSCVRPDHLFLGDQFVNMADAIGKRRLRHGETAIGVQLTEGQVLDIRTRYANGSISQQVLADEYGVSQTQIGRIVRGTRWKHLVG